VVGNALGSRSSVQSTGASVENINLILGEKAELAIVMSDAVLQAFQAFGAFQGQPPKEDLRGLMSLYPNYVQLVTLESSGIRTFNDLRGKRVGVGAPNSDVEVNARLMLEAHNLTYADIRPDYLNYGEAIDQMRNGLVDAAFATSGIPNSLDLLFGVILIVLVLEGARRVTGYDLSLAHAIVSMGGTSLLLALASFAAAVISGGNPMRTGYASLKLSLAGFIVPYMFAYNGALLLRNTTWGQGLLVVATSIVGVILPGSAVEGYLLIRMNPFLRVLALAGAFFLMTPNPSQDLYGLAAVVILVAAQVLQARRTGAGKLPLS
jgi:TRAP-type uncharacterized transport system fused permease subunit